MVLCIIAAIVFGILSIFSARYRPLAKESFRCTFRMITFRKCDVQLKERLRAGITGRLMTHNPRLASFTYHNFRLISWVFVIVLFTSMIYTGYSAYNLVAFGSCDPHGDFCVFSPDQTVPSCGSQHCAEEGCECGPKETLCTNETGFEPCEGSCDCSTEVCG